VCKSCEEDVYGQQKSLSCNPQCVHPYGEHSSGAAGFRDKASLSPQVRMKVEFARANNARFPRSSSVRWMKLFMTVRLRNNNAFHPAQSKGVRRAPRIPFKCPRSLLTPQWASNSNSSWRRMDPSQGKEAHLRILLLQRLRSWILISKRYPKLI